MRVYEQHSEDMVVMWNEPISQVQLFTTFSPVRCGKKSESHELVENGYFFLIMFFLWLSQALADLGVEAKMPSLEVGLRELRKTNVKMYINVNDQCCLNMCIHCLYLKLCSV